jgi:hypothetical protein
MRRVVVGRAVHVDAAFAQVHLLDEFTLIATRLTTTAAEQRAAFLRSRLEDVQVHIVLLLSLSTLSHLFFSLVFPSSLPIRSNGVAGLS